ncbi:MULTISPECIES: hypothetical protein [unclassified Streptomyces]|uniref:hypothetical protein n=1 Tax=unclassified Streptomyces TaxID=2593676 RepID=UPI0006AE8643|nr:MULTISPECIES: hypothetical protein [unclassified Streptomyces]KOX34471.1 hypothetical protein ADL06_07400 [Streptomyces sp. NRRL F-6491]KOX49952.1 hypothetical protein ADL08_07610 [Streptomyces sp. NRRL F-6492]
MFTSAPDQALKRLTKIASRTGGDRFPDAAPRLQGFFVRKLVGTTMPWVPVAIAAAGAGVLRSAWRRVDRRFPA